MEPVHGVHLGLVVSAGQDPENRNRVQVWVPHLSVTSYTSLNAKVQDPKFKDPAIKGPADLYAIDANLLDTLQKILPWAECAAPFFGGSSGLFNTATKTTANTTGSTIQGTTNDPKGIPQTTLNQTLCAVKPIDIKSNEAINNTVIRSPNGSVAINYNGFSGLAEKTVVSINTDGPNNPVLGGVKEVAPNGIDSMSVIGIVVNDRSLLQKEWTAFGSDGQPLINPNTGKPIIFKGQDINPSHGVGNVIADQSQPVELTPPAIDALQAAGLNISYSNNYQSVNGSGSFSLVPNSDITQTIGQTQQFDPYASGVRTVQYTDGASKKGMVPFNIAVAGSAVGTYSTPPPGAKVFVFFLGGDIQKPVYFAQTISPGDMAALTG